MSKILLALTALAARLIPLSMKQAIYRLPGLARFIRRSLNRLAPQELVETTVAAGKLAGAHLFLNLQDEKDYWLGTYEPELQAAIADLVNPGDVAYDVGANIGYISILLARNVGENGKVYAFEALPANLERLSRNLKLNGLETRVEVIPAAVVDSTKMVSFLIGPSGGMGKAQGSAGRHNVAYSDSINVSGIALDQFVYQDSHPAPQVVKMDIEGGEVLALAGMRHLLREARPVVLIELHGPEAAQVAWEELTSAGYRLSKMEPRYRPILSPGELDWKAYLVGRYFG
jgi:FkbM family methyltransferase